MKIKRSSISGINPAWNKQPEKAKKLLIENLPINYNRVLIIGFLLFIVLPIISHFFKIPYFNIIYPIILIIFVLWLILYASYKHKKKTGRLLNEDIEKIKVKEGYYK